MRVPREGGAHLTKGLLLVPCRAQMVFLQHVLTVALDCLKHLHGASEKLAGGEPNKTICARDDDTNVIEHRNFLAD
jgi:hypothetical protein